jgi:hypothetical protein
MRIEVYPDMSTPSVRRHLLRNETSGPVRFVVIGPGGSEQHNYLFGPSSSVRVSSRIRGASIVSAFREHDDEVDANDEMATTEIELSVAVVIAKD